LPFHSNKRTRNFSYNGVFVQGGEHDTLDGMTPLDAVVRILNNQLTSLMWIDEKVGLYFSLCYFLYIGIF